MAIFSQINKPNSIVSNEQYLKTSLSLTIRVYTVRITLNGKCDIYRIETVTYGSTNMACMICNYAYNLSFITLKLLVAALHLLVSQKRHTPTHSATRFNAVLQLGIIICTWPIRYIVKWLANACVVWRTPRQVKGHRCNWIQIII